MKRKHMKLPNGFGQITKLKGNLRKPYRVMVTVGHNEYGKPISKLLKPNAYFETYNDAYIALIKQNENPYDANKDALFKEVYEDWYEDHKTKISASRARQITYTWKKLSKYYDVRIKDLRPKIITQIINEHSNETGEVRKKIKSLINQVMDYAVMNDILDKNYSRISMIKIDNPNEVVKGHITFTDQEISTIWKHKDEMIARWILIQCYTGLRPNELCSLKIQNINEKYMIGGSKTAAGINRVIPIHKNINQMIKLQIADSKKNNSEYLLSRSDLSTIRYDVYKRMFYEFRDKYQLNSEHTPHDCRKFFVSQAKKYQMDEYALKRIIGHKITDLTERVYTARDNDWLYTEMQKIKVYE